MDRVRGIDMDYPTPEALQRRIELASDPIFGEIFHNLMEDYRWWGNKSKYGAFKTYFEKVRYREIHQLYHRYPLQEFASLIEHPEEKESWSVLPITDSEANLFTAYPPGVDPPVITHSKSPDMLPFDEATIEKFEVAEVQKHVRHFLDLSELRDEFYEESKNQFYERYDEIHTPYWTGEAVVPDVSSKLPEIADSRYSATYTPYSAFDRLAVEEIFGSERPIGDMSAKELAKGRLKESHRADTLNLQYVEKPAAWGEQVALRQAYERALYTHHIASLIAAEQGVAGPNAPLPDPRLSSASLLDARARFASRLSTLDSISRELPSTAAPLERLRHQANIAAHVVAGMETGFLPSDPAKLPRLFQEALAKLKEYSFILDRASAIEMHERGVELSRKTRYEILANPELSRADLVHWSGPEERYERAPRRLESWEKVGEKSPLNQAFASLLSDAPSASSAPTTSTTLDTAPNVPTITNQTVATQPAEALASETSTHVLEPSKYIVSDQFDWKAFNQDVYRAGMTEAEFDVACEAMLQAVDLHFQQHTLGLNPELLPEAQRHHLTQSPAELFLQRNQLLTAKMVEYDKGHPFPTLPKKLTRESYQLFEERVKQHIAEREEFATNLSQEVPLKIPSLEFSSSAPSELITPESAAEAPLYWSEAIMDRLDEEVSVYHQEYSEFLMKDSQAALTLEEVRAFAERHTGRLGRVGFDGTPAKIRERFVNGFLPFNWMSEEEKCVRYGEESVAKGMAEALDRDFRIDRAKRELKEMERYWDSKSTSLGEQVRETFKTTAELEKERREEVALRKDVYSERMLSMSQDEHVRMIEALKQHLDSLNHTQQTLLALRDMNIIQTDVELNYLGQEPVPRLAVHQPLPRWAVPPMRVVAAIQQYLIRTPIIWASKAWFHLKKLGWPYRKVRQFSYRLLGAHHIPDFHQGRLDSMTAHYYHPYYRRLMFRYLNLFDTNSTKTWNERLIATENYIPSWFEWRTTAFKMRWIERLASMVRPGFFWIPPATIFTAVFTYVYLEQRKTWAHDLLRNSPAGLEIAAKERRQWIQRNQMRLPRIFSPKIGPRGIWFGLGDTPAEYQNAPYLHRAYSSNARDYNPLD